MQVVLSIAIAAVLTAAFVIAIRWRNLPISGSSPTSLFTFIAILFTSGLDVGLIMFPLTEFPVYEQESVYQFANPLAIEFGFWGFLIWAFYFLTTFYFCVLEPRFRLFEIPWIRFLNNVVIIGTCAFTGYLFLGYLPDYIQGIPPLFQFGFVALVVLCAVLSSTHVRYVKILSVSSTWVFFALVGGMWLASGMGLSGLITTSAGIGEYFTHIQHFVFPMSDYHAFYLFWWFSWSIMIGQFVSRFVGGMKTWQLMAALLIFPSIPIGLWFSVLYFYYSQTLAIAPIINFSMIVVGVIFVINSLDSLTRLYTDNLNLSYERLGRLRYIGFNWGMIFGLILLYQFTPLQIEWIGLVVIGIFTLIAGLLLARYRQSSVKTLQE